MIRVLHAPTTVGGNPQGLSRNLNRLGICSRTLTLEQNYLRYDADIVLWQFTTGIISKEFARWRAIWEACRRYDVIHFNFGTTLACPVCAFKPHDPPRRRVLRMGYAFYAAWLQRFELLLYRLARKPLFVHFQGDDARQGDFCLRHFKYSIAANVGDDYYNRWSDAFKRKNIRRLARHCRRIYAVNPDLLHVLPAGARFVPYCHIDLDDWRPVQPQSEPSAPLHICHAPSHRNAKGTDRVLRALDCLKSEGYRFELDLVEGLSHVEARKRYEACDVLVDQVLAGWYGGLAVEAMALGKPVVVYIREEDLRFIPDAMRHDLPFVRVTPDTVADGLRRVLNMPRQELLSLGRESRAFVEKWHDPLRIARQIRDDYLDALATPAPRRTSRRFRRTLARRDAFCVN